METLKEFPYILIGQKLVIHTDHLNILYSKMASPCIVRWRFLLEKYGVKFVHVKGEENVVADTLSHHPTTDLDNDDNQIQENGWPTAFLEYLQQKKMMKLYISVNIYLPKRT